MNTLQTQSKCWNYSSFNLPLPLPSLTDQTLALFLNSRRSAEWSSVERSRSSIIDSQTTQTVSCYLGLHYPSSIALIAHSCSQSHTPHTHTPQHTHTTHTPTHHTHTPTILHPPRSFSNCWVLFSIYHCIAIATLQSHSQFPVSSLALFLVYLPVTWSFPVFSYRLNAACPEVYGLFRNDPLPCCFGLCLHLACTLARLEDSPFASPSGFCSPSTDSRISLDTLLSCLNYSLLLLSTYACFMTTPLNKAFTDGSTRRLCWFRNNTIIVYYSHHFTLIH